MGLAMYVGWYWAEPCGTPRYVGWGKQASDSHPADRLWDERLNYQSDLTEWLQRLSVPPDRFALLSAPVPKSQAQFYAAAKRDLFRKQGFKLLSNVPWDSHAGGGAPRPVLAPDNQVIPSVRQAAALAGVNCSTIVRWCQASKHGWRYL